MSIKSKIESHINTVNNAVHSLLMSIKSKIERHINNVNNAVHPLLMSIKSKIERHIYIINVAIGTTLLTLMWIGIAPSYSLFVTNEKIVKWMGVTYNLIDGNVWLNIPILIVLVVLCVKLCKYKTPNSLIIGIIVFVCFVLYYQSPFKYATLFWVIDYRSVFASIGVIVIITWLVRVFWKGQKKIQPWQAHPTKGFSMDSNKGSIHHSDPVLSYAESIVEKLKNTEFSPNDGSFAIGVTSEWGSGKTTFLELLKDNLIEEGLTDIISFNPWMCNSPEQVTRDFFTTLRNDLSDKYPFLSNPIRKYAKYLDSTSFFPIKFSTIVSDESLIEMKGHLSKHFAKLKNPVVVIIDDLDRLNSDEVFEVLRLIRNTASISNIIYLVAYDKAYITKILENKNISSPAAYLEKIFQLEIQLPLVTSNQVWEIFETELESQLPDKTDINFISRDRDLIEKVLNTFRRAKRFARIYSLSYDFFSREDAMHELEKNEVLLIDLLHMDDKRVYDILSNSPEKILDSFDGIWVYKESRDNEHNIVLKDGSKVKDTTNEILTRLWGESKEEPAQYSIRRKDFSKEYFTLNVQFSRNDFETMINSDDVDSLIFNWHENQKLPKNFFGKIEKYKNDELTVSQKKNLLFGILSYSLYELQFDYKFYREIVVPIVNRNTKALDEWLDNRMNYPYDKTFYNLNLSTTALFLKKIGVVTDLKMQELIKKTVSTLLDNYKVEILSIFNSIGWLFNLILAAYYSSFHLFAFSNIIDSYSQKETKPSIDDFCEIYNREVSDDWNSLSTLFGEKNWKCCRDILFLTCIDISRINDYKNNKLVREILENEESCTEPQIIQIEEKHHLKELKEELRKQIES